MKTKFKISLSILLSLIFFISVIPYNVHANNEDNVSFIDNQIMIETLEDVDLADHKAVASFLEKHKINPNNSMIIDLTPDEIDSPTTRFYSILKVTPYFTSPYFLTVNFLNSGYVSIANIDVHTQVISNTWGLKVNSFRSTGPIGCFTSVRETYHSGGYDCNLAIIQFTGITTGGYRFSGSVTAYR